jgi:hypothetical protein
MISQFYQRARGDTLDQSLLSGFFAMEIIRRLIGVAQLSLAADLRQRAKMIEIAVSALRR